MIPYVQTLLYPLVWDDATFIEKNTSIHTLSPIQKFFTDSSTLSSQELYNDKIYRPLRTVVFALLFRAVGAEPFAFHLTSVLLHAACSLLVLLIVLEMRMGLAAAFVSSCLFAVHPVHTEAVTWVSSLGDVLSSLFFLLAFLLFVRGRTTQKAIALVLLFPLAMLSKEMGITWPAVLMAWWIWQRQKNPTAVKKGDLLWIASGFAVAVLYFVCRGHVLGGYGQDPLSLDLFIDSLGRLPMVVGTYAKVLVWPFQLSSLHKNIDLSTIGTTIQIGALITLAFLVAAVLYGYYKKSVLGFWAAWFWITLSPVLNFVPLKIHVAERFVYLPSVAFCVALGVAFSFVQNRYPPSRLPRIVGIGVLAVLVVGTIVRNRTWKSSLAVYQEQINQENPSPYAYWNLGHYAASQGDWPTAINAFSNLVVSEREATVIYDKMAFWYLQMKNHQQAIKLSLQSLDLDPENWVAYNNLGFAKLQSGKTKEAIILFNKAIAFNPKSYDAHMALGNAYFKIQAYGKAAFHVEQAIKLEPSQLEPRRILTIIQTQKRSRP
jgi:tetratricopeptide (TPR) repeat protein